jgi:hypothetical protein
MRNIAVVSTITGLALLAAACGSGSSSTASSPIAAYRAGALHYAHCMRSHRVIDFPDPDSQGGFPTAGPKESDQIVNSAMRACAHLWHGAVSPTKKTKMDLYFTQCMRTHGYPDTPDSGGFPPSLFPPSVINSAKFISTMKGCANWEQKKVLGNDNPFLGPP